MYVLQQVWGHRHFQGKLFEWDQCNYCVCWWSETTQAQAHQRKAFQLRSVQPLWYIDHLFLVALLNYDKAGRTVTGAGGISLLPTIRPKPPSGRQGLARIQSGRYIIKFSQCLTLRLRRSARIDFFVFWYTFSYLICTFFYYIAFFPLLCCTFHLLFAYFFCTFDLLFQYFFHTLFYFFVFFHHFFCTISLFSHILCKMKNILLKNKKIINFFASTCIIHREHLLVTI